MKAYWIAGTNQIIVETVNPAPGLWLAALRGQRARPITPVYPDLVRDFSVGGFGKKAFIVYLTDRLVQSEKIYGTHGRRTLLNKGAGNIDTIAVSPSGTELAYVAGAAQNRVYVSNLEFQRPQLLIPFSNARIIYGVSWSPDGKQLALSIAVIKGPQEGTDIIAVVRSDGKNLHLVATPAYSAVWSPDGSSIAYLRPGLREAIFEVRPDGSAHTRLTSDVEAGNIGGPYSW